MAHQLSISKLTGTAEMFYAGGTPWHELGVGVAEAQTSAEALRLAQLEWTVDKQPLFLGDGTQVKSRMATYRTDTGALLGVVSAGYKVFQNREVAQIADGVVGEASAMFHTAGALYGGRRVWFLVKLPESLVVVGDDVVDQYLLLATSHDGWHGIIGQFTPIRVVCDNTLTAALAEFFEERRADRSLTNSDKVYIRHTPNAKIDLDEIRRTLKISQRYFEVAGEAYRAMSARQLTDMTLKGYFEAVVPVTEPTPEKPEAGARARQIHEALAVLFQQGRGNQLPGVAGTLWAAYNAVTEWVDHSRGITKQGAPRKGWAEAALFGEGSEIKQRAFDAAVAVLKG